MLLALASVWLLGTQPGDAKSAIPPLFSLASGISFLVALYFYLKAKGRSGWWMLLMIFSLIGLLVIFFLKDLKKSESGKPLAPGEVPRG